MHVWKDDVKMWDWHLQSNDGQAVVVNKNDSFEVNLEVPYFKAEEVDVNMNKTLMKQLFYCICFRLK